MKNMLISSATILFAANAWAETPPPPPEQPITVAYERTCSPVNIAVYFETETADVSSLSRSALESAIDAIDGCAVTSITATTVSLDANSDLELLQISEERVENVLAAIAATGIWAHSVQTDIVLTRSTNRPDTAIEPIARRVEVEFQTIRPISS